MIQPLSDTGLPLRVRIGVAEAALAYANALVKGDEHDITNAHNDLADACDDLRICIKAQALGM